MNKIETIFAGFTNYRYAIAMSSCTTAIVMYIKYILRCYKVILPTYFCQETARDINKVLEVEYCGVEMDTFSISYESLKHFPPQLPVVIPYMHGIVSRDLGKVIKSGRPVLVDKALFLGGVDSAGWVLDSVYSVGYCKPLFAGYGGFLCTNDINTLTAAKELQKNLPVPPKGYESQVSLSLRHKNTIHLPFHYMQIPKTTTKLIEEALPGLPKQVDLRLERVSRLLSTFNLKSGVVIPGTKPSYLRVPVIATNQPTRLLLSILSCLTRKVDVGYSAQILANLYTIGV